MNKFISCDWGTSSFRLRLIDTQTFSITAQEESDEGIANTFNEWKKKEVNDQQDRIDFYLSIIKKNIKKLEKKSGESLENALVIISGMASSTIGIIELPYQSIPCPIDGRGLNTHTIKASSDFNYQVLVISGIRSHDDVMRGEETQLIGFVDSLKTTSDDSLYILPGTHSKHVFIKDKQVVSFKTYMTGEFFNLLSTNSILNNSIEPTGNSSYMESFKNGVRASLNNNLLHSAFSVRTNDLFNTLSKKENYFYLSGLLIGTELQDLLKISINNIYICGGINLSAYYSTSLEVLGLSKQTTVIPSSLIDEAAIRGQFKIYNTLTHG